MNRPALHLATQDDARETVAQKIQRLQAEVLSLGRAQALEMRGVIREAIDAAREVATNPAQPAGVRQLAEKVVRDGESVLLTLDQITARAGR